MDRCSVSLFTIQRIKKKINKKQPILAYQKQNKKCLNLDSNPQTFVFKSDALPSEQNWQVEFSVKYFHHKHVLSSEVLQCFMMMQFIILVS